MSVRQVRFAPCCSFACSLFSRPAFLSRHTFPSSESLCSRRFRQSDQLSRLLGSSGRANDSPALRTHEISNIRRILTDFPELCKERLLFGNRKGYGIYSHQKVYPLIQLCFRQAPFELVELAYNAYPEALKNTSDVGKYTALHWACSGANVNPKVIKLLVEKYPGALAIKSWGGRTPLHHACENNAPLEVVQFVAQRCPHDIQARDNYSNLPLHLVCGNPKASLEVVKFLTDLDENTAKARSRFGLMESRTGIPWGHDGDYTPLHHACGEGAPLDVMKLLVDLYPEALKLGGKDLPLHLACARKNPSLDVLKFLVSAYPPALQVVSKDGCTHSVRGGTPVQLVTKSRPSLEVIMFLYDSFPAALDMNDNGKCTALSSVCSNNAPPEVINFLLEKTSSGPTIRNQSGGTLLHSACYNRSSHHWYHFSWTSSQSLYKLFRTMVICPYTRLLKGVLIWTRCD